MNNFLDKIMDENICTNLTICGSYRYRTLKEQYQAYYTIKNNLTLMPINYAIIKNEVETAVDSHEKNAKIMADIHDKKILLSEAIIIVCGIGYEYYIGKDTARELIFAFENNKTILFSNVPAVEKHKYYFNNNLTYPLYMLKEEYK